MAMLMLISSMGLSFDMHFCQGHLQNVSMLGKAQSCHEMAKKALSSHCKKMLPTCHQNTNSTKSCADNNCCQNEKVTLESLDKPFTSPEIKDLSDVNIKVLFALIHSYCLTDYSTLKNKIEFIQFEPPPDDKDLHVLYQSFLI